MAHRVLLKITGYDHDGFQLHLGKCSQGGLSWPNMARRIVLLWLCNAHQVSKQLMLPYLVFRENLLNYSILARMKAKLAFKNSKFEYNIPSNILNLSDHYFKILRLLWGRVILSYHSQMASN